MSPSTQAEPMFKAVLVGDGSVGKTSIRRNYLGKGFIASHLATIGVDFAQKYINLGNQTIRLVIWDLAGQTSFERIRKHYYQGCSALILVYSVVDRDTFDNLTWWLIEAFKYNGSVPPTLILGNKIDLRGSEPSGYEVTTKEGIAFRELFSNRLEIPVAFFETSAKTGENISEAFAELTKLLLNSDIKKNLEKP
jgi:small GTP-binding protein